MADDKFNLNLQGPVDGGNSVEIYFAKEAKGQNGCRGKLLGCFIKDVLGIKVRTKWQSSSIDGDTVVTKLKGNRCDGDIQYLLGKACWT